MRRRPLCTSASRVTASLLLSFLALASATQVPFLPPPPISPPPSSNEKDFSLRHVFHHGTYKYPQLHRRLDVPEHAAVWTAEDGDAARQPVPRLHVRTETVSIQRLADRSRETITGILDWGREKTTGPSTRCPAQTSPTRRRC